MVSMEEFHKLFDEAISIAVSNASKRLQRSLPSHILILFHGLGYSGELVDVPTALNKLYINEKEFYAIIDLSVCEVDSKSTTIYLVVSGHTPRAFEKTWNNPPGCGPFKQLEAENITIKD